jgi:Complex I intermediate-associated protein 30 (CIA30)
VSHALLSVCRLKTRDDSQEMQQSSESGSLSYRAKFPVTPCIQGNSGAWTTVQIPWKDFVPHITRAGLSAGSGPPVTPMLPLDTTSLVRLGIVVANNDCGNQEDMAISEKIVLGISGVEFYKD